MGTLNLVDLIKLTTIPLDDVVVIRHTFKKETLDILDKYDRRNFEEYRRIQPVSLIEIRKICK